MSTVERTQFLDVSEGRIAYEVWSDGPLMICAPGMGGLRFVYRFMAPSMIEAGYRVALTDLRGTAAVTRPSLDMTTSGPP